MTNRILVTGAGGQVGRHLLAATSDVEIVGVNRRECDIGDRTAVNAAFEKFKPTVVINAAAFTNVDRAESEPAAAYRENAEGVRNLADAARDFDTRLIHISTDYVFDGTRQTPYPPDAPTNPLNVYGASKLAGENALLESGADGVVVRAAWVFSAIGKSFLSTMLQQMKAGKDLRIVADQTNAPTYAADLAAALLRIAADSEVRGVVHFTNVGSCNRFEFANALLMAALEASIVPKPVKITAVPASEFPSPARRPEYSVLDSTFLWQRYGAPTSWVEACSRALSASQRGFAPLPA